MPVVAQNIDRLNYLLALFKLTKVEFLKILNDDGSTNIVDEEVFSTFIKISTLNKIDKIFKKGLSYYTNPYSPITSPEKSIFFRKSSFNSSLTLRDKQIVNKFEEEKVNFDTLLKLTDTESERVIPSFTIFDSPKTAADVVRKLIYPSEKTNTKGFLKNLISTLAKKNVLVFEFIERHNRAQKATINGFYLSPNVIVLKWQKYNKREVFTLAHEVGHYLLNEEDIDQKVNSEKLSENLNEIERWCNQFAFNFLIGNYSSTLKNLDTATIDNYFHSDLIVEISKNTHLSTLALYTHLLYIGKISKNDYKTISDNSIIALKKAEEEENRRLELKKAEDLLAGKTTSGGSVKELISPLYIQTLQAALYSGVVDEYEFCRMLNIKPNKIESYLA